MKGCLANLLEKTCNAILVLQSFDAWQGNLVVDGTLEKNKKTKLILDKYKAPGINLYLN